MEDQDYDEDIYEETTSKVVYKKRSRLRFKENRDDHTYVTSTKQSERHAGDKYRTVDKRQHRWANAAGQSSDEDEEKTWSSYQEAIKAETEKRRKFSKSEWAKDLCDQQDIDQKLSERIKTDRRGNDQVWQFSHHKTREAPITKLDMLQRSFERLDMHPILPDPSGPRLDHIIPGERHTYFPVTKWEVDYNNKNYIRSTCNKTRGYHRYVHGRRFDWDVDYDNTYYARSKVNPPKGLHRRLGREIKRKRVPDNDILADSTNWEFEYGPEFAQSEEDVTFNRDLRVKGRGGFRYPGVKRNESDTDRKIDEKTYDIKGYFEEEFKCGPEFLQDDIQHLKEFRGRKFGRGGYKYQGVDRNPCDIHPMDFPGVDYRDGRATLEIDVTEDGFAKKGKPFKRTIFKKTYRLVKPPSPDNFTRATGVTFVPGEGSKSFHEGKSMRRREFYEGKSIIPPLKEIRKRSSIRDVFRPGKEHDKMHKGRSGQEFSTSTWKQDDRFDRKAFLDHREEETRRGKFPIEIQNKINEFKHHLPSKTSVVGKIKDWREHENHPHCHGSARNEGYEKFVNERGSEIWIKTEDSYSEFHHKAKGIKHKN